MGKKWKKKYHTVRTTPKSSTHIHDRSLSLLSTGASTYSFSVTLLLHAHPDHLSEIMRSCKYFQLVTKMPTHIYRESSDIIKKKYIYS